MTKLALLVVLAPTAALAQPALTPPTPPAEPMSYVAPALEIGGNTPEGAIFAGIAVEGGYRLSGELWLHGKGLVAKSDPSRWGDPLPSGNLDSISAGVEWRHRYLVAGVDGMLVRDVNPSDQVAWYSGAALAGHAGLELGGEHFHFRPSFEYAIGGKIGLPNTIVTKNYGFGGLSLGVAYVW